VFFNDVFVVENACTVDTVVAGAVVYSSLVRATMNTRCIGISMLVLASLPGTAFAVNITSASCTQQADNVLRYDCSVATDVGATVWVDYCNGSGCTPSRSTPTSQKLFGGTHTFTLYGLKPSNVIEWEAYADAVVDDTQAGSFTTDSLADPDQDSDNDPDLANLNFTMTGAAEDVEYVLINAACSTSAQKYDYLLIVDADGDIVWYQDPRPDANTQRADRFDITGLSFGRPVQRPLAVVEHEYAVEYSLEGDRTWKACRKVGAACPDASTADSYLNSGEYFHHDAIRTSDGLRFALTAELQATTNTPGCGVGPPATWNAIVDGLAGFNAANTRVVNWEITDLSGDYPLGIPSTILPSECDSGYWDGYLDGYDFAHLNSIWVDDKEWTFSALSFQHVFQVNGDPMDGDYLDLNWILDGTPGASLGGWFTPSADASVTTFEFGGQHTAYFEPTTNDLVFYDNNTDAVGSRSRGVVVSLDDTMFTARFEKEYPVGATNICKTQGSGILVEGSDNMLLSCANYAGGTEATYYMEVDEEESQVWKVAVSCDGGSLGTGLYRAIPITLD
jgi:hypothetical protein